MEIHRVVRGTVYVNKRVETHEEVVNIPAVTEEVVVERLPVNTVVEGIPLRYTRKAASSSYPSWKKSSSWKSG